MSILEWLNSNAGHSAVAGAFGGVIRWVALKERWPAGLVTTGSGGICAVYLGPIAAHFIPGGANDPSAISAGAFLAGVLGTGIVGFVLDLAAAWAKQKGKK